MIDKLKVFISSCESELVDERAISIKTIKKMGFKPIGSERRTASNLSIEKEYLDEVSKCDIYIGIFGKQNSYPTINEYYEAIKNKKPTLIFQRIGSNPTDLHPDLLKFLEKVKDPKTGKTIKRFKNVVDLSKEIKKSIISTISNDFRKPHHVDKKISTNLTKEYQDMPKLGYAEIIESNITDSIDTGSNGQVYAKIRGEVNFAFLDLLIINPDGQQFWFPDLNSWDISLDKGSLILNESKSEYSNTWIFSIPKDWTSGIYSAYITVYEDTYYLPTVNRRLISFVRKTINIKL
jgi:hypothetical protein